jgi:hypothetical protein
MLSRVGASFSSPSWMCVRTLGAFGGLKPEKRAHRSYSLTREVYTFSTIGNPGSASLKANLLISLKYTGGVF